MPERVSFDYAVVRVVPRVEREEFLNVGVIVSCPARRFLAASFALDETRLAAFAPWLDPAEIGRWLEAISLVCAGDERAGAVGRLSQRQRFDWLVAPRSTVVQTSPAHAGLCEDPAVELAHLVDCMVRLPEPIHEDGRTST
jgi:hypothetical protein